MLAARILGPNRIEPVEVETRKPAPGEALVRVESCGFRGSDFGIVSGKHPRARAPAHNLLPLPADYLAPLGALLAPAAGTRRKQVLT